jgi:hypothetical protein
LLLKYTIAHPAVTAVIPGTTKLAPFGDNQAAGGGSLGADEVIGYHTVRFEGKRREGVGFESAGHIGGKIIFEVSR